jgi:hypothetical protein
MKKIIFILVSVFAIIFTSYAQDRVNGEIFFFNNKSKKISNFVLCEFNEKTLQWNERDTKSTIKLEMKSFVYDGTLWYSLHITFLSGYYRYPYIKVDYETYKKHYYAILTKSEYDAIINVNDYQCYEFYCYNWCSKDENVIIREMINEYKENNKHSPNKVGFALKKHNNVIRFFFTELYSGWFTYDRVSENYRKLNIAYYETSVDKWSKLKIN